MNDDNIQPLFGEHVQRPEEPVPEVIELLESLLHRAKSGVIRAVAVTFVRDSNIGFISADAWRMEDSNNVNLSNALCTGITCLSVRFAATLADVSVVRLTPPSPDPDEVA